MAEVLIDALVGEQSAMYMRAAADPFTQRPDVELPRLHHRHAPVACAVAPASAAALPGPARGRPDPSGSARVAVHSSASGGATRMPVFVREFGPDTLDPSRSVPVAARVVVRCGLLVQLRLAVGALSAAPLDTACTRMRGHHGSVFSPRTSNWAVPAYIGNTVWLPVERPFGSPLVPAYDRQHHARSCTGGSTSRGHLGAACREQRHRAGGPCHSVGSAWRTRSFAYIYCYARSYHQG